ncbi:hypothetical protein Ancab_027500 [Ancistrocladus abbreviatus]
MAVDHDHQRPSSSLSKRKASGPSPMAASMGMKRGRVSSKSFDIKLSLVAQRLSMLQDYDKDENERHDNSSSNNNNATQHQHVQVTLGNPSNCGSINRRKDVTANDESDFCKEFKSSAMKRAQEVQANLQADYPSFTKYMLRSHVTLGFWLGLPKKFCSKHLPKYDTKLVLVDEDGNKYDTNYLASKVGLSGGWRGFSLAHHLQEGDVGVFQLVGPSTFKVYIVRANSFDNVDGAQALLTLDACAARMTLKYELEKDASAPANSKEHCEQHLLPDTERESLEEDGNLKFGTAKLLASNSDSLASQVVDGIRLSQSVVSFDDVTSFESFRILVDGLMLDPMLHDHLRRKYYELCCSQKSFLHEHLLQGLNCTLIVGIISETINIADAIRACKASSFHSDFVIWEKTLEGFELLGMNVAFLRTQLQRLLGPSNLESESWFEKVRVERARAGEKMKILELKLLKLKEAMEKIDAEIEEAVKVSTYV